jgi:hypothetical protein
MGGSYCCHLQIQPALLESGNHVEFGLSTQTVTKSARCLALEVKNVSRNLKCMGLLRLEREAEQSVGKLNVTV